MAEAEAGGRGRLMEELMHRHDDEVDEGLTDEARYGPDDEDDLPASRRPYLPEDEGPEL